MRKYDFYSDLCKLYRHGFRPGIIPYSPLSIVYVELIRQMTIDQIL